VRLLLDTHVFLWLQSERSRLPSVVLTALADLDNALYLSVASAWELGIKYATGKLPLPQDPATWLASRLPASGTAPLPISLRHVLVGASLPRHHHDPFDRLLVAQAQIEGLTLVTGDTKISAYIVDVLWD
jgi:PIN domain nuclease of toxin-antitoxin system